MADAREADADAREVAADKRKLNADLREVEADARGVEADAREVDADARELLARALFHYTQLVRHRMANPLQVIVGAAATLRARTDLPIDEHLALLDVIVKEAVVLERICLAPKIMDPSEETLDPTSTLRGRALTGAPGISGPH